MFKLCLLSLFLMLSSVVCAETIHLREPPKHKYGQYVKELYSIAYGKLGMEINFTRMTAERELMLAKKSQVAGLLARDRVIEQDTSDFVRIAFPLFEYQVLLYSDRRACGYCTDSDLKEIAYLRGGIVYKKIADTFPEHIEKLSIGPETDVRTLLLKGRVSSVLVSNMSVSEELKSSPHFIKREILTSHDYHYLSPEYHHLKDELDAIFESMESSGEVAQLRAKYRIDDIATVEGEMPDFVRAVNIEKKSSTVKNQQSDTYLGLLESALGSDIAIKAKSLSWREALNQFENQSADILIGAYRNALEGYLTSEYHLDYNNEVIAVAKSNVLLEEFLSGNESINVCIPGEFESSIRNTVSEAKYHTEEITDCLKMFDNNEIQVIAHTPMYLDKYSGKFPRKTILQAAPLFILFHNNATGRLLKNQFDRGMALLAENE